MAKSSLLASRAQCPLALCLPIGSEALVTREMTKAARITYDDVLRALKAVKAAGFQDARVIMRLEKGEIEVVIGHPGLLVDLTELEEWTDDDV
jgi:hypothetical protein